MLMDDYEVKVVLKVQLNKRKIEFKWFLFSFNSTYNQMIQVLVLLVMVMFVVVVVLMHVTIQQ
jgi:hypothetical protein